LGRWRHRNPLPLSHSVPTLRRLRKNSSQELLGIFSKTLAITLAAERKRRAILGAQRYPGKSASGPVSVQPSARLLSSSHCCSSCSSAGWISTKLRPARPPGLVQASLAFASITLLVSGRGKEISRLSP